MRATQQPNQAATPKRRMEDRLPTEPLKWDEPEPPKLDWTDADQQTEPQPEK